MSSRLRKADRRKGGIASAVFGDGFVRNALRIIDGFIEWGGVLIRDTVITMAGFYVRFTGGSLEYLDEDATYGLGKVVYDANGSGQLKYKHLSATGNTAPNCYVPGYGVNLVFISGRTFEAVPEQGTIQYHIAGTLYTGSGNQVTHDAGHASFDRYDAVVLDTNGAVVILPGSAEDNPPFPIVDPTLYKLIRFQRISATATDLVTSGDVDQFCAYKENAGIAGGEWDGTAVAGDVDMGATVNPNTGITHIRIGAAITASVNEQFNLVGNAVLNRNDYDVLRYNTARIAPLASEIASAPITWVLRKGNKPVASITVDHNNYGYDVNSTTKSWVVIPLDDFNWIGNKTEWDALEYHGHGHSADIDDICFQGFGVDTAECCGHIYPNELHVDPVNGVNETATKGDRNKPWKDLAIAEAAASSGDTIVLHPGAVTQATTLGKDGITYKNRGAITATTHLINDGGSAMTVRFINEGTVVLSGSASAMRSAHADSVMYWDGNGPTQAGSTANTAFVNAGGKMFLLLNESEQTVEDSAFIRSTSDNGITVALVNDLKTTRHIARVSGGRVDLFYNKATADSNTTTDEAALFCTGSNSILNVHEGHTDVTASVSLYSAIQVNGGGTVNFNGVLEYNNTVAGATWADAINMVGGGAGGTINIRNSKITNNSANATSSASVVRLDEDNANVINIEHSELVNTNTSAVGHGINFYQTINSPANTANAILKHVTITLNDTAIGAGAKALRVSAGTLNHKIYNSVYNAPVDGVSLSEYTAGLAPEYDHGNSGAALTVDFARSNGHKVTLTDNCTFTFSNFANGQSHIVRLVQDGTGSRTVTWPAAVQWPGGTAPTLSTPAGSEDIITFYKDGDGNIKGVSNLNFS